ncbi:FadR family transcriptional regulator [Hyphomicrobium methylovorum]|uniref:FadR/GntR family transcriptional regulator n=1 Tax=Hyphomicrobium methylovorum TaxID=84 RepID=UPI0015E70AFD|nr:FCD domain-containing protein [Hyphomicrobium methylovorum]MBA2127204.1 FadR family transcriptional regulator [Hyphomicrobium methylovorum]
MNELIVRAAPWLNDTTNQPFVKERVKEAAGKIFMLIQSGRYSFGSRLDAERILADELDITRTTIRQAIDFLEHYDVVKRRANSGTFVTYRPSESDANSRSSASDGIDVQSIVEVSSPFEMSVVCSLLEPEIARLATLYMSVRDLTNLRRLLEEIETIVADGEQFAHLEKLFLMQIAEGTHNRLLITMYRIICEVRKQPQWCATRIQTLSPVRIREIQKKFRSLYEALECRDIEGAVEFMKLLVASNQEDLIYQP